MTEEQLTALLRLKRHEQPPPGYFDDLLHAVHRRQREELLQRPLWKITLERWQTFFSAHSMGGLSYAGAMAGVLALGLVGVTVLTPAPQGTGGEPAPLVAKQAPPQLAPGARMTLDRVPNGGRMQLAETRNSAISVEDPALTGRHAPRYVIDARPVSYAPSLSF